MSRYGSDIHSLWFTHDNETDPQNATLKKEIQSSLLEIAYEFVDFVGLDFIRLI